MIKYSIIIPTAFDHLETDLKPCIESIKQYTDLSQVEVIVVANGCTDGTKEYVQSLGAPFCLLNYSEPLGYAKAINKGLSVCIGDYVILLNNDCRLLEQKKNEWLKQLALPFKYDEKVGITGPLLSYSKDVESEFLVFFCVMIRKELWYYLRLNEDYTTGGSEDIEYCIEAKKRGYKLVQVPAGNLSKHDTEDLVVGGFPIFHKGEATVKKIQNWKEIFDENTLRLVKKYNPAMYKHKLGNDYERAVIDSKEDLGQYPREVARYKFAAQNLKGKKVLEIGCSSAYGLRLLPEDIEYTGVDYDETIIAFAKEHFASESRKFLHCDIHNFEFTEHFDTIIAFEVIEHLTDGKELAQKLKQHCDTLLISTPYCETPGVWGHHHVLHKLTENDFPEFEYTYLGQDGSLLSTPNNFNGLNLMLMKWENGKTYNRKKTVLAFIPTKNRYDSLAMTLQSVALQTRLPDKVLIYDDGAHKDLRGELIYKHLFNLFDLKGIKWEVIFGDGKGQHFGHEIANTSNFDFVWRIDDDEIAEPTVLATLLSNMKDDVGAVAGAVITPGSETAGGDSKLFSIFSSPNIQWSRLNTAREVDHLYSSFLYRTNVAHYNLSLSPVAHREETMFTLEMKKKGYKLLFTPEAVTYHFRHEKGGIRENTSEFFFRHDEQVFKQYLESNRIKVISLNSGLGDHLAFLNIIPDIKAKYDTIILGCCYPDVFKKESNIVIVPYAATKSISDDNVYKWCTENNWKSSIIDAYKQMLGV